MSEIAAPAQANLPLAVPARLLVALLAASDLDPEVRAEGENLLKGQTDEGMNLPCDARAVLAMHRLAVEFRPSMDADVLRDWGREVQDVGGRLVPSVQPAQLSETGGKLTPITPPSPGVQAYADHLRNRAKDVMEEAVSFQDWYRRTLRHPTSDTPTALNPVTDVLLYALSDGMEVLKATAFVYEELAACLDGGERPSARPRLLNS